MLAFKINSTSYGKLRGEVGRDSIAKDPARRCDLDGTGGREQDERRKPVLKDPRAGTTGARRGHAGQMAYLLSICIGPGFFGEGTTGPEDCSAGAGIRPSERTGDLEVNWTSFYPGMREEGPQRQSIENRKFTICSTPMQH